MRMTDSSTARRGLMLLAGLALLLAGSAKLSAQTDPRLVEAVRMAASGQSEGDSARARVEQLLTTTPTTDSLYPQLLYTKGMIANDAAERQRAFQRVVVEFGSSGWADKALFRLAQVEYAAGNTAGAVRYLERIRNDYPDSPVLGEAAYWAGRIYQETNDPASSCRWVSFGLEHAGSDVELTNRLTYLQQRCQSLAAADTAPARPATPTPANPPARGRAPGAAPGQTRAAYQVQVAAVTTQATADRIAGRVRALGLPAEIVRAGGFYKVRAGSYQSRSEAQAAAGRLKQRLGGAPFVVAAE